MFYTVLGVRPGASEADIRAAYRRKALQVHPDKGGTSAAFARVQQAYQKALSRTHRHDTSDIGGTKFPAKSRGSPNAPPPWAGVRAPRTFLVEGGGSYIFETHPSAMGEHLRAGDIVRTVDGVQGIVVGVTANGVVYFKRRGDTFVVPIPTSKGAADVQKYADVDVLYRADAQEAASPSSPTPRTPRTPRTPHAYTLSSPFSGARDGDPSATPNTPRKGFRYTDVLERQRDRTMAIFIRKLIREEEERRSLLIDVVNKAYMNIRESKEAFLRALQQSTARPQFNSPRREMTPRKVTTPNARRGTPRVQRVPISTP